MLAPGRALLPALGCLAFLLMANCRSQLPNAFPWCGKRMYSVFPSWAVFLCYYKSSLLLHLWRQCLRQECLAFDKMVAQLAAICNVPFLIFQIELLLGTSTECLRSLYICIYRSIYVCVYIYKT